MPMNPALLSLPPWRRNPLAFRYVPGQFTLAQMGATFSRASTATYVDQNGIVQTASINTPRDGHYIGGVRSLLLEAQSTNRCINSSALNSWTNNGCTFATGLGSPDSGTSGVTVTATGGSGGGAFIYQTIAFSGDGTKAASLYLKQGTATQNVVSIYDSSASTHRGRFTVTWSAGTPTVALISGTGTAYTPVALANGWWRIGFSAQSVVAANTHWLILYPDFTAGTGTVTAWGGQAEDLSFPSSYIPTTTVAVTRSADSLSFPGVTTGTATLFQRYYDIATAAWVDAASAYTSGTTITPTLYRAYQVIAVLNGTYTAPQAAAILGVP